MMVDTVLRSRPFPERLELAFFLDGFEDFVFLACFALRVLFLEFLTFLYCFLPFERTFFLLVSKLRVALLFDFLVELLADKVLRSRALSKFPSISNLRDLNCSALIFLRSLKA